MQDPLVNQADKPFVPSNSNQPVNAPPVSQPQIIQQPSQPYIVQLANPSYAPQSIPQPYIIQAATQPQVLQTLTQPYIIQPSLTTVIDSRTSKKKLCCLKFWLPIKFIPWIIDIILTISRIPLVEIVGIIVLIIVTCLIYQSTGINGAKKYNIAFHIYTVYVIFACIFYLFFIYGMLSYYFYYYYNYQKNYDYYYYYYDFDLFVRKNFIAIIYLIEIGIEITTLYLLCIFKKEFDKVPNDEDRISILPPKV